MLVPNNPFPKERSLFCLRPSLDSQSRFPAAEKLATPIFTACTPFQHCSLFANNDFTCYPAQNNQEQKNNESFLLTTCQTHRLCKILLSCPTGVAVRF